MPRPEEPAFRSIAIAGLGLIGGSIALAVRERWPSVRIVGVDQPSVLAHATGSGAIDRAAASIDDVGAPELIILAAPVRQNVELLRHLASIAGASQESPLRKTVISDVGGTKRDIVDAAHALSLPFEFVGSHPIGGAERGGFGFARPDLFNGRPWIFTPDENTSPDVITRLHRFVVGLGARPATLTASEHDRVMAYISHLPQLTASALMTVVGTGASGALKLAGRGLVDTTRLASSPASVWRDISVTNEDFIAEALDGLIAALVDLRKDLKRGDVLDSTFGAAERWRAELMKGRD
jgi:prephenate dehydrogenase